MSDIKTVLTDEQIWSIIKDHLISGYNADYLEDNGFHMARAIESAVLAASDKDAKYRQLLKAAIRMVDAKNDPRLEFGSSKAHDEESFAFDELKNALAAIASKSDGDNGLEGSAEG